MHTRDIRHGHRIVKADVPAEHFLADYPAEIRDIAERLRRIVLGAVPDAIERVRPGWRLIGYDVPMPPGRKARYFAYVAPEPEHAHLGFEYGIWLSDPDGILLGAQLGLRQVRYLTYQPGEAIPSDRLLPYVREAADLAALGPRGGA